MQKTILFVDDSASIRELVKLSLQQAGFDVLLAEDGLDALAKLDGRKIHLVITDLHMPNMNGMELIQEIRKRGDYAYIPILFLTTETLVELKREARKKGATGWITKPFNQEKLLHTVNKVLR